MGFQSELHSQWQNEAEKFIVVLTTLAKLAEKSFAPVLHYLAAVWSDPIWAGQGKLSLYKMNEKKSRARGYNNNAQGRAESSRLWLEVAALLNAEGIGTTKTPKEWSIVCIIKNEFFYSKCYSNFVFVFYSMSTTTKVKLKRLLLT